MPSVQLQLTVFVNYMFRKSSLTLKAVLLLRFSGVLFCGEKKPQSCGTRALLETVLCLGSKLMTSAGLVPAPAAAPCLAAKFLRPHFETVCKTDLLGNRAVTCCKGGVSSLTLSSCFLASSHTEASARGMQVAVVVFRFFHKF